MRRKCTYILGGIARPLVEISRHARLGLKVFIKNAVAFLLNDAVIDWHSLSYGNHEQGNRAKNEQV